MGVPLNIEWQQILLHFFNFAILAGGLHFLLYSPVKNFMDQRTEYYKAMDEKAKADLCEAEELKDEYSNRLKCLDDEITAERMAARKETEAIIGTRLEEAKKQAEQIIISAQQTARTEHDRIVSCAQQEIVGMVLAATEKVILDQSASLAFDQFLDAAEREEAHVG